MKIARASLKTRDTSVRAGIDEHTAASITIDVMASTPADLEAVFQSQITVFDSNAAPHK